MIIFEKLADDMVKTTKEKSEALTKHVDNLVKPADDGSLLQGVLGNYSSQDISKINDKWKTFLINEEEVISGYKLVRDELILTNYRIIFIDIKGVTGQKKAISQIYLDSVIDVSYTAAGFGFDDTDIYITYMSNPYKKSWQTTLETHHFEFPKKQDVTNFYRYLVKLSINNRITINQ